MGNPNGKARIFLADHLDAFLYSREDNFDIHHTRAVIGHMKIHLACLSHVDVAIGSDVVALDDERCRIARRLGLDHFRMNLPTEFRQLFFIDLSVLRISQSLVPSVEATSFL